MTEFRAHRQEECSEFFSKTCSISFSLQATNSTVRKCYRPLEKVCDGQGEQVCHTVFESSCNTKYIEKQPGQFVGDTRCEKLPVEVCGAGCTSEEGEEECHDETVTTTSEVPEESCELEPKKRCQGVYRLLPFLSPSHQCKEVPREVCTFGLVSGVPGEKPLTTKWCYNPQSQGDLLASGLRTSAETASAPATDPEPGLKL